jgi:hypothetical protein
LELGDLDERLGERFGRVDEQDLGLGDGQGVRG